MLHKLTDYPIRPVYQPGESLGGFLSRHFCSNGHEIPKPLGDALATLYKSKLLKDRIEAWDLLFKTIGSVPDNYRCLWIEEQFTYPRPSFVGPDEYWQRPLTRNLRICPQCVQSFGIHLALWDLPLVLACPTHKILLVVRCDCGKVLRWPDLKTYCTCSCGIALTQLTADPAPRSLVNTALSIAAAAGFYVPDLPEEKLEKFRIADTLQSTYSVFSWLNLLLRELGDNKDDTSSRATPSPWRFGHVLTSWPHGLMRQIRYVMARRHQAESGELMLNLSEKSRTKELLLLLRSAVRTKELPANLTEAIQNLLDDICLKPLESLRWIFNPALASSHRERKKSEIQLWWADLKDWMEHEDTPRRQDIELNQGLDQRAIDISAKILNSIAKAAMDPTAALRFRRFARVWPPFPKDVTAISAADFLELMGRQLLTISSSHREYLYELSLNAGEVRNEVSRSL